MEAAGAQIDAAPEVVISPPKRWAAIDLRELWAYRELIYFLTKRELQIRYKQSFFGVSWAILQPLTFAFVLALFFGVFFKGRTVEIPYVVFVVSGIVPWLFTSQAVQGAATGMVKDADLISKVYFPRLALPVSQAGSLIFDMVVAFAVVVAVTLLYGVSIASTFWLVPAFILLGIVTTFALGTLFAAVNVKYRDVQLVMPMVLQVLFFATPVIYPPSYVSGIWTYIWSINPLVSVVNGIRWALYSTPFPGGLGAFAVSVGSALVLLAIALIYFQRTQRFFADIV